MPLILRVALAAASYAAVVFAAALAFLLQYGIEGEGGNLGYVYLGVAICLWAFAIAEWWTLAIPGIHFLGYEGAWRHLTTDVPISYSGVNPVEEFLLAAVAVALGIALRRTLTRLRLGAES